METSEKYQGGYPDRPPTVYEARDRGREYSQTDGAEHYQHDGPEPMDLLISCGLAEGYCLGAAIMYATRYRWTRELGDLKKAVDMLHIFCGVELSRKNEAKEDAAILNKLRKDLMQVFGNTEKTV